MAKKNKKTLAVLNKAKQADEPVGADQTAYTLSVFQDAGVKGFKIKTLAPVLKPSQFPLGKALVGTLEGFIKLKEFPGVKGEAAKIGTGVQIKPDGAEQAVIVPLTGVIRNALDAVGDGAECKCEHIGRKIAIQRLPEKIPSKRGQAAWNFIVGIK